MGPVEALRMLSASAPRSLRAPMAQMGDSIARGSTLADAMALCPGTFDRSAVQVIRASEKVGEVARGFDTIADGLDERIALRRQLVRSAIYPMIVIVVHIFLTPITLLVLESTGAYMSTVARGLTVLVAAVAIVVWGIPFLVRATPLGPALRRLAWRLPWPATVYVSHVRTMFARTLSGSLAAGVTLYEALRTSAAVTSDPAAEEQTETTVQAVGQGSELAPELVRSRLVDPADAMVLVAGERAGTLTDALSQLGERYSERRTRGLKGLMTAAGGALTLAVFVFVAMSIVETYQSITSGTGLMMDEIEKAAPFIQMGEEGGVDSMQKALQEMKETGGPDPFQGLGNESPFRPIQR